MIRYRPEATDASTWRGRPFPTEDARRSPANRNVADGLQQDLPGVQIDQIVLSPNACRNGSPGTVSNDNVIGAKLDRFTRSVTDLSPQSLA